ncbi:GC-rich sequence DNA-binding factor protein [Raphanus sativus]|nr:GC-rich sequence DNA-binding factor protein [Raphanus sativus]
MMLSQELNRSLLLCLEYGLDKASLELTGTSVKIRSTGQAMVFMLIHLRKIIITVDIQPLQPLVDCILALGKNLEKRHASGLDDAETTGLARRLKRMLVELHEHDHAREIVRTIQSQGGSVVKSLKGEIHHSKDFAFQDV